MTDKDLLDNQPIENAEDIIDRFGGIRPMSAKIDVPVTTVQGWKKRNVIPGSRRDIILKTAQDNNIDISDLLSEATLPPVILTSSYSDDENTQTDHADQPVLNEEIYHENRVQDNEASVKAEPEEQHDFEDYRPNNLNAPSNIMAEIEASERKAVRNSIWASAGLIALVIAGAGVLFWPSANTVKGKLLHHDEQLASINGELLELNEGINTFNEKSSQLESYLPDTILGSLNNLKEQADNFKGAISQLDESTRDLREKVIGLEAGNFGDRMAALEDQLKQFAGSEEFVALVSRVRFLEESMQGQEFLGDAFTELQTLVGTMDEDMKLFGGRADVLEQEIGNAKLSYKNLNERLISKEEQVEALRSAVQDMNKEYSSFKNQFVLDRERLDQVGQDVVLLNQSVMGVAQRSEGLIERLGNFDNTIAQLAQNDPASQAQIIKHADQISALGQQIASLGDSIQTITGQTQQFNTKLIGVDDNLAELTRAQELSSVSVVEQNQKIESMIKSVQAMQASQQSFVSAEELQPLREAIISVREDVAADVASTKTQGSALGESLARLDKQVSTIASKQDQFVSHDDLKQIGASLASVQTEIKKTNGRSDNLQTLIAGLDENVQNLVTAKAGLEANQKQVAALGERFQNVDAAVEAITQKTDTLSASLTEIDQRIKQLGNMKQGNNDQEVRFSEFEQNLAKLEENVRTLSDTTQSDERFVQFEKSLNKLQMSLQENSEVSQTEERIAQFEQSLVNLQNSIQNSIQDSTQEEQSEARFAELEQNISNLQASIQDIIQKQQPEQRIVQFEENLRNLQESVQTATQATQVIAQDMAELQNAVGGIEGQTAKIAELSESLSALNSTVMALSDSKVGNSEQMIALRERLEKQAASLTGLDAAILGLQNKVAQGNQSADGRFSALDTRLVALNEKLKLAQESGSALGQTLEGVSGDDLRAAAMLIAFSQMRSALNREAAFEDDLVLLQKLAGNDNPELQSALSRLAPHANGGVLTAEGLTSEFKGLAGDIVFASLAGEDVSVKEKAKQRVTKLFESGQAAQVAASGDVTQVRVANAQAMLDQGNINGAIAELQKLDGEAGKAAQPFIQQAEISLMANQVQSLLRETILSKVSGAMPDTNIMQYIAPAGSANLNSIKQTIESVVPGNRVIRDEESGVTILQQKGFKGLSSGQ